jgi:hypothetical protein
MQTPNQVIILYFFSAKRKPSQYRYSNVHFAKHTPYLIPSLSRAMSLALSAASAKITGCRYFECNRI